MRLHAILAALVSIGTGSLLADDSEQHPGQTALLRYIDLVNQGDVENAKRLERRSREILPEAWDRVTQGVHQFAKKTPLKIQESWKLGGRVFGATSEVSLRASQKDVILIGTSEIDGQWFVSTFTVLRAARWEKTQARFRAEGGELVFQAESSKD